MPPFLEEIVVLVAAAALVAYLGQRFRVAPLAGFLLIGVVIGPNALGLVESSELIDTAAEVGVLLLLFTIGIEFRLESLGRIRRVVLVGGTLQVAGTIAATTVVLLACGVAPRHAVFTGFLVALSSTAVVLRILSDRGETRTAHGETALGILVFQDLAVLAMMLLVPALAGEGGPVEALVALGKAAIFIAIVLLVARRVMPRLLEAVARTCSAEVFLLTVLAICLVSAYLFSLAGVSLSLGAFLAGLLVSESPFGGHALGEILPVQILFSAAFFVSIGLLVDARFLLESLVMVVALALAVVALKTAVTALAVRALGRGAAFAAGVGLMLAQVGEFSFVLERVGRGHGLHPGGLDATGSQIFVAGTVLLLLASPALYTSGRALVRRDRGRGGLAAAPAPVAAFPGGARRERHVLLAGYGPLARRVAPALTAAGAEVVVATLSPEGAREAESLGLEVLRGDYAKRHVLERAAAHATRAVVVADDEPDRARAVVTLTRQLNPQATIAARARHTAEAELLRAAGADVAVADETESAAALVEHLLLALDVGAEDRARLVDELRRATYAAALAPAGAAPPLRQRFELTSEERQSPRCRHTGQATVVSPGTPGCEECLRDGERWVHLRVCMTCGHVGCCDSSPHRHARAHWSESRHPLMKSAERGEDWTWCYIDEAVL